MLVFGNITGRYLRRHFQPKSPLHCPFSPWFCLSHSPNKSSLGCQLPSGTMHVLEVSPPSPLTRLSGCLHLDHNNDFLLKRPPVFYSIFPLLLPEPLVYLFFKFLFLVSPDLSPGFSKQRKTKQPPPGDNG